MKISLFSISALVLSMSLTSSAFAVDLIDAALNSRHKDNYSTSETKQQAQGIGESLEFATKNVFFVPVGIFGAIVHLILLPFAVLNEGSVVAVDQGKLGSLGYTTDEIQQYGNDIYKIRAFASSRQFGSKAELQNALARLNLGIVAKEQLRLQ